MGIFTKSLTQQHLVQISALLQQAQKQIDEDNDTLKFLLQEKINKQDSKYRAPQKGAQLVREGKLKILTKLKKDINNILAEF